MRVVVFCFSVLVCVSSLFSQGQWKKDLERNNVIVWTKIPEGSKYKDFKCETIINSNMGSIYSAYKDVNTYPKWIYKYGGGKALFVNENGRSGVNYCTIKTPWPLSDRDMVVRYDCFQNKETGVVTIKIASTTEISVPIEDKIRMPVTSSYTLIPLGANKTKVIFQSNANPGGEIPASVINLFVAEAPYYTLINLKKMVESPDYQKKTFDFITEY